MFYSELVMWVDFVALDMIERVYTLGSMLSENVSQMSKEEIEKYKNS